MSNSTNSGGGIGFTSVLQILFIALKLLGKIAWSWWWVLSPTWIAAGLSILALTILAVVAVAQNRAEKRARQRR